MTLEARVAGLVEIAAAVVGAPIALVGLFEDGRHRPYAATGLSAHQFGACASLLDHRSKGNSFGLIVLEDALTEGDFALSSAVVAEPHIRFYAAYVLRDRHGEPLGTLAVMDSTPRGLDERQRRLLTLVAGIMERKLDLTSTWTELELVARSERAKALVLNTMAEGLVLQDRDGQIVEWNPAAERVLGLSSDQLAGRTSMDERWRATHADGSPWPGEEHPAMVTLRTGVSIVDEIMGVHHPDGNQVWLRVNSQPVIDDRGGIDGVLVAFADVTAETEARREADHLRQLERDAFELQARALSDNQALLRELHHRVKNNLQVMSSLMSFQAEQHPAGPARDGFVAAQSRVHAIAAVHDRLFEVGQFAEIDLTAYAENILADVAITFDATDRKVGWSVSGGPLPLPADIALPCALIVSELVTNAFKHAFVGRSTGRISVRIERGPGGSCSLAVSDDGVGLEISDELPIRPKLGLDLVNTFIEQIDGNMRVYVDSGTTVTVAFELPAVIEPASLR